MNDLRESFLHHVHSRRVIHANRSYSAHINESLMEAILYTIVDYINHERDIDELGVGAFERKYSFPDAFTYAVDPRKWLDENRTLDDSMLVMAVFDNITQVSPGKHRRALLYLINILDFDL